VAFDLIALFVPEFAYSSGVLADLADIPDFLRGDNLSDIGDKG